MCLGTDHLSCRRGGCYGFFFVQNQNILSATLGIRIFFLEKKPIAPDFIFDMWLWHGDLYRVSPFQVYRTSTSCLPRDLEFFMFAVMKTFVTDISASTGRNDFIFDMWLLHGDLYRVSPFQVYRTSTSCLPYS